MTNFKSLLASACILLSACSTTPPPTENTYVAPVYETYVQVGQQLPLKEVTSINNETINLHEQGKRKLVIFFATWCSDSQRTIKTLLASPLMAEKNLTLVGIGREENKERLENFANHYQVNFPLVTDEKRELYSQFANAGIPRLIVVDENNNIVQTLIGEDPNTIEKILWPSE